MISPFSLPVFGASLLAAVAVGVHLGESAVGLIDPIHFQGPALHPRDRGVAIDERTVRPHGPVYAEHYGWEEGQAARATDCGHCEALSARDAYAYSAEVPWFGGPQEVRVEPVREVPAEYVYVEAPVAAEETVEPKDAIVRYAYYPLEAEAVSDKEPASGMGGPDDAYE